MTVFLSMGWASAAAQKGAPVRMLMDDAERRVFESLDFEAVRGEFLTEFWKQRPESVRAQWTERVDLAISQYDELSSARATHLLKAGPPKYIVNGICPEPFPEHEIWNYSDGGTAVVAFIADETGVFHFWDQDWTRLGFGASENPEDSLRRACGRGAELVSILEASQGPTPADLRTAPADPLWVKHFVATTTLLPDMSAKFAAETRIEFSARVGDATAVVVHFEVARDEIRKPQKANFSLVGEVYSGTELADRFRYTFANADATSTGLKFSARRHIAPGRYNLRLKLHQTGTNYYFQEHRELDVPTVTQAEEGWAEPGHQLFKLLPAREVLLVGNHRFDTVVSGGDVAKVAFYLNGEFAMSKRTPPYSVELDLGNTLRPQQLEAIAYDKRNVEVARDSLVLNSGPHRFAVRLIEPSHGQAIQGQLKLHAQVDVPVDQRLDYVDFFWNEERLARLFQPPFVQTLETPTGKGSSYVRAVAVLEDDNSAQDLVVVNTGNTAESIEVDFVELYASVQDETGAGAQELKKTDFRILEDGVEQRLLRLETVNNLPINAAVMLDTSTSMTEEIEEAERAAAKFFENVVRPRDRAAVIVFSDVPQLRVPLTNDVDFLNNGLSGIEANGETSLYDSLIYGLYYLTGLRGKRALILISDGADSVSDFSLDKVLDFARRSGVALYTIGLGLSSQDLEERRILRLLARETGGETFNIESARRMDRIYEQIENELRSQYLFAYQSSQSEPGRYREVEIEILKPGLEVKAPPGYYP